MSPRESFEEIARLLTRAAEETDPRAVRCLVIAAQTHAVIQASTHRRRELRAEMDAYLETGALQ